MIFAILASQWLSKALVYASLGATVGSEPIIVNPPQIPPHGQIYHGVGTAFGGKTAAAMQEVTDYLAAQGPATQPALINPMMMNINDQSRDVVSQVQAALSYAQQNGATPIISLALKGTIPASLGLENQSPVDLWIPGAFANSTGGFNGADKQYLETLYTRIKAIGDKVAAHPGPVFVRPGYEFNSQDPGYHPGWYPQAFRRVVDILRQDSHAMNVSFIWCYHTSGLANYLDTGSTGAELWYPGDAYVDWWGVDGFLAGIFTVAGCDPTGARCLPPYSYPPIAPLCCERRNLNQFLEDARTKGFPVMVAETSAAYADIEPGSAEGLADWEYWFEPFFDFIEDNNDVIRGFVYLNTDWPTTAGAEWEDWGDARVTENTATIIPKLRTRLRNGIYVNL